MIPKKSVMQQNGPAKHFVFLLIPGFSLVALSCAIDALRAANIEAGKALFYWTMVAEKPGRTTSSSGIAIDCVGVDGIGAVDLAAVCGGERSHLFSSANVGSWLKLQARRNVKIGSISDAAYVLADIGLFNSCRSTIHWKCQSAYRERFPDLDIRTSILEIDGNRFSCAGGTASLDLMLHFVAPAIGTEAVGRIADNYFHDVIRDEDQLQPMTGGFRYAARNKIVSGALFIMEAELEVPSPISQIARKFKVSHRQLNRLFHRYLGTSAGSHYRDMRLARTASLLRQTNLKIGEIALCCGFQSSSHLSKFFKKKYSTTPLKHRICG